MHDVKVGKSLVSVFCSYEITDKRCVLNMSLRFERDGLFSGAPSVHQNFQIPFLI